MNRASCSSSPDLLSIDLLVAWILLPDQTILLEDLVCLHSRLQGELPREHSKIVLIGRWASLECVGSISLNAG